MFSNQSAGQWQYTYAETDGPETPPTWSSEGLHFDLDARLQDAATGSIYHDARPLRHPRAEGETVVLNRARRRGLAAKLRALGFKRIIVADTEYNFGIDVGGNPLDGNPLRPVCVCAQDLLSSEKWEIWLGEFPAAAPFPLDASTLLIAFNASAEAPNLSRARMGCARSRPGFVRRILRSPKRARWRHRPEFAGGTGALRPGYRRCRLQEKHD